MRIVLSPTTPSAIETVAQMLLERLETHPASVIGLATGRTMEPVYAEFVKQVKVRELGLSQSFYFMLDEYLGIDPSHPSSFKSYIQGHLIKPLRLQESQFAFPPVNFTPIDKAAEAYEQTIRESSGIDLQLLGIGQNGHVGFNEPGSGANSRTRVVELTQQTREANKEQFLGEMPVRALSMGIETIKEAKSLLMLATGRSKADAIKYLVNHHDDPSCPATYLKSHPHFTLVLDPEAASKINLKI